MDDLAIVTAYILLGLVLLVIFVEPLVKRRGKWM